MGASVSNAGGRIKELYQTTKKKRKKINWISIEKKPADQSEAVTVVTEPTSSPVVKPNAGSEYEAHEVKILQPDSNANAVPSHEERPSLSALNDLPSGVVQGGVSTASSPSQVKNPTGPAVLQQSLRKFAPSFLLVPKRRVLHNVRSNVKGIVPGNFLLLSFYKTKTKI